VTPNEVCEVFCERGVSLRLEARTYELETSEELAQEYIIIEGNAEALRFLGELLVAQATFPNDCHCFIHPSGPGSVFFGDGASCGVSIHRLPCEHGDLRNCARPNSAGA